MKGSMLRAHLIKSGSLVDLCWFAEHEQTHQTSPVSEENAGKGGREGSCWREARVGGDASKSAGNAGFEFRPDRNFLALAISLR